MDKKQTQQFKRTSLYDIHLKNNAKMVDFAGWLMPIEYTGILKESKAARESCVLFDVSHMGEIRITGDKALDFIQYLTTNNAASLKQYRMQYNLFINDKATIIDDFMLYRLKEGFLCVVNASNKNEVLDWLNKNIKNSVNPVRKFHSSSPPADKSFSASTSPVTFSNGVKIKDESDETALLSLQGPFSRKILEKVLGNPFDDLEYMHFMELKISGIDCLISRSGYTGEDGFELYCDTKAAQELWSLLVNKGGEFNLGLAGLGARDVLRIEAGYPLYGHEINEEINPIEASLGWAVKAKYKDFIGKNIIIEALRNGVRKKRIGFVMKERGVARRGYSIYKNNNQKIGTVTSGIYSPNLDEFIGMGYVDTDSSDINKEIFIEIRNKLYKAGIIKFPFVENRTHRNTDIN